MRKTSILLLVIIGLIFTLSTVKLQECSRVFADSVEFNSVHYCPVATFEKVPMTILDFFQSGMDGVIVCFILGFFLTRVLLKIRPSNGLSIMSSVMRRINAAQNAICSWMNRFGIGFANSCYM